MRQRLAPASFLFRLGARPLVAAIAVLGFSFGTASAAPGDATTPDAQSPSSAAGAAAPTITVRPGFDGMGKVGDWLPVTVQVSNDGPNVRGRLQVEVDDNTTPGSRFRGFGFRPPTIYTVLASLPSHSRKQYQIDVFLPFLTKSLTVKLVTNTGVVVQRSGQLQALSGSDVLCGALSRSPNFFQQLHNLDLPGRQGKKPFVAALSPQDVPSRQQSMSSLDCLIVNNISLAGLTNDQKNAILGWVDDGGLLIAGGGPGWQKTLQPLPKSLMPVNVTGVRAVPSLRSLANFAHQPIKGQGPWLVSAGKLVDGTVVARDGGVPVLVGARRGKGNVMYLAPDPTSEPLNTWSGNAALWKYLMSYNTTPLAVYPFFNAFGGFSTIQNWGLPPRGAIFNVSSVNMPSIRWLLVFLLAYGAVAGPLNFLILRVAGREELGWVTVPLLIAGGAFVSFRLADQYRGSDLILNKISLVRSEGNSSVASVRSYVSLYSPRQGSFNLSLPGNASISSYAPPGLFQRPFGEARQAGPRWKLQVDESDAGNTVHVPLNVTQTGTFFADSQVKLPGRFDSTLQVHNDQISGRLINHTGQTVDNVVLAVGQNVHKVGRMVNGESKQLSFGFDPNAPSSSPNADAVKAALVGAGVSSAGDGQGRGGSNRLSVLDAFLGVNS
ncbi:MAG: hypothetical protein ACYDAG_11120, partial [Chloroflexota bacterium]